METATYKPQMAPATPKPGQAGVTVGRTVHFYGRTVPRPTVPLAAIVTGVHPDGAVSLFVMTPNGEFREQFVHYSENPAIGCWTWPPKWNPQALLPAEHSGSQPA